MRRVALLVTVATVAAWGIAGALGGCGGATASDVTAEGPDGSDPGSSSSSGASGSSSGDPLPGSPDGSSPDGSRPDGSSPDGSSGSSGSPDAGTDASSSGSNPGKVTCGSEECNSKTEVCCVESDGASCRLVNDKTKCTGVRLSCDEPADCAGDQACCFGASSNVGSLGGATCQKSCLSPAARACKTDADCGGAGKCTEKTCAGNKVRTCGDIPMCS